MSKVERLIFSVLLVAFILSFNHRPAAACTCAINPSPEEELKLSTAVFSGRVVSTDLLPRLDTSSRHPVKVTLEVDTVWKGPERDRISVYTAIDSGACGFDFNVGWKYLVYARGSQNDLEVSTCTRTAMLSYAGDDLAALGEGVQIDNWWRSDQIPITISIWLGLVIVAILIVVTKRIFSPDR